MRIAVCIGTRPEAVKMAPVIAALEATSGLTPVVINTGQHRELLAPFIERFNIRVDYNLASMEPGQQLAGIVARLITLVDQTLDTCRPDMVLVQGDTSTVFAAALAAFFRRIPVGHVEAGLRTGNVYSPFPEEANRRLTTPLTTLHFAPTELAANQLRKEGVPARQIILTGNPVIDALQMEMRRQERPEMAESLHRSLSGMLGDDWRERPFVLITGHRRENFGRPFEQICDALEQLALQFPDHRFVYPVHLNPNVQGVVHRRLGAAANIRLIEPLPYGEFVALLSACRLVLTDSGGVQEEGPALAKPVLVMRDTTERPEGVEAGTARLVGANTEGIVAEAQRLLTDDAAYQQMANAANPYGDGHAAERIVQAIEAFFAKAPGPVVTPGLDGAVVGVENLMIV